MLMKVHKDWETYTDRRTKVKRGRCTLYKVNTVMVHPVCRQAGMETD